jgi:hypothetical protein
MIERTHKFLRPFDAKQYLVGAPVGCRMPSLTPEILKIAEDGWMYGIIHRVGTRPAAMEWAPNGKVNNATADGPHDLVMIPLFLIDGKPVFVGDEIQGGGEVVKAKAHFTTEAGMWRWPSPKKEWPSTSMRSREIRDKFNAFASHGDMWTSVANAVIAHECEAGNLVTDKQASHWILDAAERAFNAGLHSARSGTEHGKLYFENLLQTVKENKL